MFVLFVEAVHRLHNEAFIDRRVELSLKRIYRRHAFSSKEVGRAVLARFGARERVLFGWQVTSAAANSCQPQYVTYDPVQLQRWTVLVSFLKAQRSKHQSQFNRKIPWTTHGK
jgi:hypothetical protein